MASRCDAHGKDLEWIELFPGRRKFVCIDCHNKVKTQEALNRVEGMKIRYAQNWSRDRPFTDYEKRMPGGIAPRPKW